MTCYQCQGPIDPEMGETRIDDYVFCSPECATPYDDYDGDYASDPE